MFANCALLSLIWAFAVERLLIVLRSSVLWHMDVDGPCIKQAVLRGDYRAGALSATDKPA